jgi:hypothetical protein
MRPLDTETLSDLLSLDYWILDAVIAIDQTSRSPEPFGSAQDKLREGVAISLNMGEALWIMDL